VNCFDPLGNFNPSASVDTAILLAAHALADGLPIVPTGDLTRIYLHWSVQGMCSADADYHIVITEKAKGHFAFSNSHDVRDNARSTFNDSGYAAHTFHRNTGGVGIALDGMDGNDVSPFDFGSDGVSVMGLTWLCAAAAAVAFKYEIDISGLSLDSDPFYGEIATLTHGEAADMPGVPAAYDPYGPLSTMERWDLTIFQALPKGEAITQEMVTACGNSLRALAHTYKLALMHWMA
jgi:hypothetical protein